MQAGAALAETGAEPETAALEMQAEVRSGRQVRPESMKHPEPLQRNPSRTAEPTRRS